MCARVSRIMSMPILSPLYSLYASLSHDRVRRSMSGALELGVPVISVGNISFGGTGKTPTVEYLARKVSGMGHRPGVVLRGYKGRLEREGGPPEIASDGSELLMGWKRSGDEARLLGEGLRAEKIPVAVGRDRIEGSRLLIGKFGADVIILDDGFQTTGLKRDFDLALVDALAPFGRVDCRRGPLREPPGALGRADAIFLTHTEAVDRARIDAIGERLRSWVEGPPPIFLTRMVVRGMRHGLNGELKSAESLRGRKVAAFAGIGNPASFAKTIQGLGCELGGLIEFADHHPYNRSDMARVGRRAKDLGADALLTTVKDAVRLDGAIDAIGLELYVVEIDIAIDDEEKFVAMLRVKLGKN